jgi:hypothetical protein
MGVYIQSKQKVGNQTKYIMADTDRPNFKKMGTKQEILNAERKYHFGIDGVDLDANDICVVVPIRDTIDMLRYGDRKQALATMTMSAETISLRFKSKPTSGELAFVSNVGINIERYGINNFWIDFGVASTTRSHLSLDEAFLILDEYRNWRPVDIRKGRI